MNTRTFPERPTPTHLPRLIFLALFFFAGILLGQVLAGRMPAATGSELRRYLEDYLLLEGDPAVQTLLSAAVIYFRYPLTAFLLGFSAIGVVLLPVTTAAYGFFLSFAVSCFTASFGAGGVVLALAALGLRCLVALPCYFLLSSASWGTAVGLAAVSFGSGRRTAPVVYGRACWARFGACCLALAAGVWRADPDAGAAAPGAGAAVGLEKERGRERSWQEMTLRTTAHIWPRSGMHPRTPSVRTCGM